MTDASAVLMAGKLEQPWIAHKLTLHKLTLTLVSQAGR